MEQINLNLIPNGIPAVCHVSQYDNTGRKIRFRLFNGSDPYVLSDTETISLHIRKSNGEILIFDIANTSSDYIDLEIASEMSDVSGESICKFYIENSNTSIGSFNFKMRVEPDAFDGKITTSEARGPIASFETDIEDVLIKLKSDINPVQDLHGYSKPWSGGGGKNKLNYDAWKTTGVTRGTAVFENNGVTITATENDAFTNYNLSQYPVNARVPISEGETITISWEESTNKSGVIFIFPNGVTGSHVSKDNARTKKISYTATSGVTFIAFRFGVANSGDTIAYKNIQIEKGSQATSWEPYSNICPISGFSALNVTRTGKNILPKLFTQTTTNGVTLTPNPDGTLSFSGVATSICYFIKSFNLKKGSYIFSSGVDESFTTFDTYISEDGTTIARGGNNLSSNSFTLTEDGSLQIMVRIRQGVNTDGLKIYPMIRVSSDSDTTYTEYNGQTATVNFGQTVYGGVADVTNGKVNVNKIGVDLGSLTWSYITSGTVPRFQAPLPTTGKGSVDNAHEADLICSNYANTSWANVTNLLAYNGYIAEVNNGGFITIHDDNYTDAPTFKTAMSGVMIVYELAAPIEITTTPENLSAVNGINNIFNNTNGDVEVKFYKTKNLGGD